MAEINDVISCLAWKEHEPLDTEATSYATTPEDVTEGVKGAAEDPVGRGIYGRKAERPACGRGGAASGYSTSSPLRVGESLVPTEDDAGSEGSEWGERDHIAEDQAKPMSQ